MDEAVESGLAAAVASEAYAERIAARAAEWAQAIERNAVVGGRWARAPLPHGLVCRAYGNPQVGQSREVVVPPSHWLGGHPAISWGMLSGAPTGTAVILLASLEGETATGQDAAPALVGAIDEAVGFLRSAGATGLVLDLRYNEGCCTHPHRRRLLHRPPTAGTAGGRTRQGWH